MIILVWKGKTIFIYIQCSIYDQIFSLHFSAVLYNFTYATNFSVYPNYILLTGKKLKGK